MRSKFILAAAAVVMAAACVAHAEGDKVRERVEARKGSEEALQQRTRTQIRKQNTSQLKTQDKIRLRDKKQDGSCQD